MIGTRDNSGSVSKNDRKAKDTHPDIKGKATIDGVEYWIDGWLKENDRGKWYSLSFKMKDGQSEVTASRPDPGRGGGSLKPAAFDDGSDIPF